MHTFIDELWIPGVNRTKLLISKLMSNICCQFFGGLNTLKDTAKASAVGLLRLNTLIGTKTEYNIAHALVLPNSYWAIMNKIFMYTRPCSIKWRVQFHLSCKISVEFSASSFCVSFGKKLELLLAITSSNSYASFVLSKLAACIHNSYMHAKQFFIF